MPASADDPQPFAAFGDLFSAPPEPRLSSDPAGLPAEPAGAAGAAGAGVIPPGRRTAAGRVSEGSRPARRGAPLPVAAVVATVWAAMVSFAPILVLVLAGVLGAGASLGELLRLAGAGWLLANGVPIQTAADRISLVPLALLALVVWRLARAGIHTSRAIGGHRGRSVGRAVGAGLTVGVGYGLLGALVAVLVQTPDVTVPAGRAGLTCFALGALAATLAALGHSRGGRLLLSRLPVPAVDGVRAGVLTAALMLAVGSAGAGVSLALHGGDASAVLGGFRAGVLGQAGITAACLAFAPNAAIWATSYLIGPGFMVGTGTTVTPSEVVLGPVPALPLLTGVPGAPVTGFGPLLLAAPLFAAVVAGWMLARRGGGWGGLLGSAALAGPVAGALLAVAAWSSRGGLGSGRLAQLGPPVMAVGVWGAVLATAGVLLGVATARAVARPAARSPR